MIIEFTLEEQDKLYNRCMTMIEAWSPRNDTSDYICYFCSVRAETNTTQIRHADGCLGVMLIDRIVAAREDDPCYPNCQH